MFSRVIAFLFAGFLLQACSGGGGSSPPPPPASPPPPPASNNAPVVSPASFETSEIVAYQGTVSATDADGDTLSFAVSTQPTKGAITAFNTATGAFTYTPDPAEDGADSFGVTANDGTDDSAEAVVTVEIIRWGNARQFGSTASDLGATGGLVVTADGGQIFGGGSEGDFAGSTNAGLEDAWVRKLDARGAVAWTYHVATANAEGTRNVLPDPQADGVYAVVISGAAGSNRDVATIYRIDDGGNLLWSMPVDFMGEPIASAAYWSNIGDDGDIYVLSWLNSGASVDSLLTRVDGFNGATLWSVRLDTSETNAATPFLPDSDLILARGVDMDPSGNLVVAGNFWDDNVNPARACGENCSFIASFDTSGNELWTREFNQLTTSCGTDFGRFYRVTVADDGSLLIVGSTGSGGFDPGVNGFAISYNADATQENWIYCDDSGPDVASANFTPPYLTSDGSLLVYSSLVREPDAVTMLDDSDVAVTKLDVASGNVVLQTEISEGRTEGSAANQRAGSIAEDDDGVIFITGSIDGELTTGSQVGDQDAFIRRLDAAGTPR